MSKFLKSKAPKFSNKALSSISNLSNIASLGTNGSALISDGSGALVWSSSLPAKQKDVFLTKVDLTLPIEKESWTELTLPLYKDGSFTLADPNNQSSDPDYIDTVIKIELCFTYNFINNNGHLPFVLETRVNNKPEHTCEYGQDGSTQLKDTFTISAKQGDSITHHIKKSYNDKGSLVINKNSHYTFEAL